MIPIKLLLTIATVFLSTGFFLVFFNMLLIVVELFVKFWRRSMASWVNLRLQAMGIIQEKTCQVHSRIDWKRLLCVLFALIISISVHDLLLSPMVLLIGTVLLIWINFQQKQVNRARINEDAETCALQLRALMRIDHSLLNALTQVKLPSGILRQKIEQIASRLRMHQPPVQAAQALKGLPGNVTVRLSAVIANSAQLSEEVQDTLLLSLEKEAGRQKLLRTKTRQTLSLVRGTIRLLQGVVAAAIGFVMLAPSWRDFFLQDIPHRLLFAFLVGGVLLASLYFEYEVHQLAFGEV